MKKIGMAAGILVIVLAAVWFGFFRGASVDSVKVVQAQEADKPQKEIVIAVDEVINGETTSGEVRLLFEDSAELPDTAPDAFGVYLRQIDDTITVGSGSIEVEANIKVVNDEEPVRDIQVSHDGPEVSFQVNEATEYLKDTTQKPEITEEILTQEVVTVPGTVEPGTLDEIDSSTVLRVWGTYQDSVLVADLVVYEIVE